MILYFPKLDSYLAVFFFLLSFHPSFLSDLFYLNVRDTKREETKRSFMCWFILQWSQQLVLGQSKNRNFFRSFTRVQRPKHAGHSPLCSQTIRKELDQKWSRWLRNCYQMGLLVVLGRGKTGYTIISAPGVHWFYVPLLWAFVNIVILLVKFILYFKS